MGVLDKNTVENLIILLVGILLFNGLVNIPVIGKYFVDYPLLIVGGAVVLLVFKDKIAEVLSGGKQK